METLIMQTYNIVLPAILGYVIQCVVKPLALAMGI